MNRIKAYNITITPPPQKRIQEVTNLLKRTAIQQQNKGRLCIPQMEMPFPIRNDIIDIADTKYFKEIWDTYFKFN